MLEMQFQGSFHLGKIAQFSFQAYVSLSRSLSVSLSLTFLRSQAFDRGGCRTSRGLLRRQGDGSVHPTSPAGMHSLLSELGWSNADLVYPIRDSTPFALALVGSTVRKRTSRSGWRKTDSCLRKLSCILSHLSYCKFSISHLFRRGFQRKLAPKELAQLP